MIIPSGHSSVKANARLLAHLPKAVQAMHFLHFEGNITPHAWYKNPLLQHENGKPNTVAIILLADICYWYRPTIRRNEESGAVVSVSKKFHADKLRWDHEQRAAFFGFTKRQSQDAIAFLKKAGIIDVEQRSRFVLRSGAVLPNQIFVEPIPEAVTQLLHFSEDDMVFEADGVDDEAEAEVSLYNGTPITSQRDTPPVKTRHLSRSNVKPIPPKRAPITKTSSEISTKISAAASSVGATNERGNGTDVSAAAADSYASLVLELVKNDVNVEQAEQAARDWPDECKRQLAFLPFVSEFKKGRGAYLFSAIKGKYGPPDGWNKAQEKQVESGKKTRSANAQRNADEQARTAQKRAASEARAVADRSGLLNGFYSQAKATLGDLVRNKPEAIALPLIEARVDKLAIEWAAQNAAL